MGIVLAVGMLLLTLEPGLLHLGPWGYWGGLPTGGRIPLKPVDPRGLDSLTVGGVERSPSVMPVWLTLP